MNESVVAKQFSVVTNAGNKTGSNSSSIIYLTQPNSYVQIPTLKSASEKVTSQSGILDKPQNQKCIFVCTFCQVFSSSDFVIVEHINKVHNNSLPAGVAATKFVSKLQALPEQKQSTCRKKVGRPRKVVEKCSPIIGEKTVLPEPIPKSDGLYWCDKCERCFKKARQLMRHVCAEAKEEDELDYSSSDSDTTVDYKKYMDVQPDPWSRKLLKNKRNCQSLCENTDKILTENDTLFQENPQSKVKLNWRSDPEYVPLFPNENERIVFENHLNFIDYSYVDCLFHIEENTIKGKRKKACFERCVTSYSCEVCSKKMNSLTHIRMHCLTHTDFKPFTCPKCPYQSNTKGSLYTHMRTHTGNVFRCSQCSFQTLKRSHLLDHEETHSNIAQICKFCKNAYKTVKSLIAHIKRFHNNTGGKRYLKSLSSKKPKESFIRCKSCHKRFKSLTNLESHNKNEHSVPVNMLPVEHIARNTETNKDVIHENMDVDEQLTVSTSKSKDNFTNEVLAVKDPLVEIVLNNLLQQKGSESIELYEDVFEQSINSKLLSPSENLNDNDSTNQSSEGLDVANHHSPKSDFDECDKNLNLDILDECLQNSNFVKEVMRETYIDTTKLTNEPFDLHASMELAYPNNSLIPSDIVEGDGTHNHVNKSDLTEPMSAENKLFEKCKRAPAYVCCVCSAIYICPSTLKAHLKEHVNSSSTLIEPTEEFEEPKTTEADADIVGVCRILQESSESCADNEKELEKLFTSSLDMMYYLPEVKVVLENDPSLFDAVWDDISNFSIPDKYEDSEVLQVKSSDLFN